MKFPNRGAQTLKHLPFFEVLANAPEDSNDARMATAGLLSLRMLDHWVMAGPSIVEPESVSVRSVRKAIMALPASEPVREALLTTVNTMQMLRQVDLVPVLPRVYAYAQLLERHHGSMALAADAYESVIRLADVEFDAELVMDSYGRLAFCQRKTGSLDASVESCTALSRMATRRKDRSRALRAKMGLGQVLMMRGELAEAEAQFQAIGVEAEKHSLTREFAMSLHNRAVVASRSGDPIRASVLAHSSMKLTTDPIDRDRVLSDLAAFLIQSSRFEAALDALRVLEVTASSEEPRLTARGNILIVAARMGDRALFDAARADLAGAQLPVESRISLLTESAGALRTFGDEAAAGAADAEAAELASRYGLAVPTHAPAATNVKTDTTQQARGTGDCVDPAGEVAKELRAMAASLLAA